MQGEGPNERRKSKKNQRAMCRGREKSGGRGRERETRGEVENVEDKLLLLRFQGAFGDKSSKKNMNKREGEMGGPKM